MPKLRPDQYLVFLLMFVLVVVSQSVKQPPVAATAHAQLTLLKLTPVPVYQLESASSQSAELDAKQHQSLARVEQESFFNTLTAPAAYVVDATSMTPLLEKNAHQLRSPASTTKLLTALVSYQSYNLNQELTVKEEAFTEGTTMGLQLGEKITVKNLLYGLLMQSGNDAAFVLANNHPQGYEGFVAEMNRTAKKLHLDQTLFSNPSGLDTDGHLSTAHDLAILAHAVMDNKQLREVVGTKNHTIINSLGELTHELKSTHELLGTVPGVIGVKTGTTLQAGEVLITAIRRDGRELLIVVMGSSDRYQDTKRIIDWTFEHYEWVDPQE